jgi:hypothetical protein
MAGVMTILGFTGAMSNIQFSTYLMTSVPKGMLARVTSVASFASLAACAIGPAIGGILIGKYETKLAIGSLFGITLLVALISVGVPSMRSPRVGSMRSDNTARAIVSRPLATTTTAAGRATEPSARIRVAYKSTPAEIGFVAVRQVAGTRTRSLAAVLASRYETTIIFATIGDSGELVTDSGSPRPDYRLLLGELALAWQAEPVPALLLSVQHGVLSHTREASENFVRYEHYETLADDRPVIVEIWRLRWEAMVIPIASVPAICGIAARASQQNASVAEFPMLGAICAYGDNAGEGAAGALVSGRGGHSPDLSQG